MLKKRYALTFLMACLSLAACKKDDDKNTTPPAGDGRIYFTGLTQTDLFGTYQTYDVTDWQVDDENWTQTERDLFGIGSIDAYNPVFSYDVKAYPNPCDTVCRISFTKPNKARIDVRVVDQEFNILYSKDSILDNMVKLDSAFLSTIRDTIRMYYRITEETNQRLYGHGDILVKESIN